MPQYVVHAVRVRTMNFVPHARACDLRVVAPSPRQAYTAARDQLRAEGEDADAFRYVVKRRGIWRRPTWFPEVAPRQDGGGGTAGVREPRRPRPSPPSLSVAEDEGEVRPR